MIETYHQDGSPTDQRHKFDADLRVQIKESLNAKDLNNLNRRADQRDYFTFFEEMYVNTQREASMMRSWSVSARKVGHKVKYRSNGVDNNGFPVLESTPSIKNADYKLWIDDNEMLVDIKVSPVIKCFTFKTNTLRRYINDNINILLILRDNQKPAHWALIDLKFMQFMIDEVYGEHGSHFAKGKPTARIWRNDTNKSVGYLNLVKHGLLDLKDF